MKIIDVETFVVGNPPPSFGGRYWIFVKVVTDGNVVGYGEVYSLPFGPHVVEAMIGDVAERFLLGEDPHHIERFWRRAYGAGYTLRPDISMMGIVSGLETACWDIIGKEAGKPVHQLLGGRVHERLRSYTYLYPDEDDPEPGEGPHVYTDPDLAAARALDYVEGGFTAVKFDPAGGYSVFDPRQLSLEALSRSEAFAKKIREAVGDRADLLFGTHGQLTPAGAVRLAKRLEPYDPLWFEEPVPPEKPEDMAVVAAKTTIPVATGERLATKYEFSRVLETGAASILQPALGRVGGLLEAKKIAGMAETHYAQIAPHLYCGPIEAAANIQLAACSPNFLILECIQDFSGFHADLLEKPLCWEDGYIIPSSEPGLGVSLNEEMARAHPYDGEHLHLEMEQCPL
ncbi:MAG: mandelate racemase/muconate lactonizing enzyme family protein [Alphaproteobacteria bacterium]|nr:mandelate racemase/muconate lactonizing enzyme family protein [Alphaproteobacteria bacterium]